MIDIGLIKKHVRFLVERMKHANGGHVGPSAAKANKMVADNSAQGHALTDKQKKFFNAIGHGWKPTGKKKRKAA